MTHTYEVEMTDTFGGEANYGWVRRATIARTIGATLAWTLCLAALYALLIVTP